jgi:hypothetical protein
MNIYPTHTCFDDAFELIEKHIVAGNVTKEELIKDFMIVHAICLLPNGKAYAHAWVERHDKYCIFKGIINGEATFLEAEKEEYYEHFKVQETMKFPIQAAVAQNKLYGTTGPWSEKYKALCGSDKTIYSNEEIKNTG